MSTLEIQELQVHFGSGRSSHQAVAGVDLTIPSGTIFGLVGESGSGKSTIARAIVGLHEPSAGRILLDGVDVVRAKGKTARARQNVQMVFQDPNSCLDPRMTIGQSIEEALRVTERRRERGRGVTKAQRAARIAELLTLVELDPARSGEYPSRLSGGQRQRVALARALAAEPTVLLADEITSALDVSVQGTVLNLLRDVQQQLDLTVLFISHNLAVVRQLCDGVAVMKDGRIVESGPAVRVIDDPQHPYTQQLMTAVPHLGVPLFPEEEGAPQ
ncbi:ABC transporter ATP-binding protein [Microbacterium sp. Root61]|uniref:ABC transporter ATP-binding protein n=1 Tax=Microbacterium sp. Root61 TaxID=1736570 RepID=UPI0006FE39A6|nr:ATP-binding cassette domain-containing protein [Microbacterium sp. Root61]KRA24202.1 ABC transporter ATP-binding protein [Microbacterium sp. Root61]